MSITDRLRDWVDFKAAQMQDYMLALKGELDAMLDIIDAEHEYKVGCTDGEWDHWESTHVELPKDGDGVHIRIGDVMEAGGSGETFEIRSMRCDEYGWEVYDRLGDRHAPALLRHHHAQTVEDVMAGFATEWECAENGEGKAAVLRDYAKRLTLAEGTDA